MLKSMFFWNFSFTFQASFEVLCLKELQNTLILAFKVISDFPKLHFPQIVEL